MVYVMVVSQHLPEDTEKKKANLSKYADLDSKTGPPKYETELVTT
jgi:hypothetical protein